MSNNLLWYPISPISSVRYSPVPPTASSTETLGIPQGHRVVPTASLAQVAQGRLENPSDRGTSLIRNSFPQDPAVGLWLGPYGSPMAVGLWLGPYGSPTAVASFS